MIEQIERALGAQRVGPSMWGDIYRSATGTYIRVLPASTPGLTARRRQELDSWADLPQANGVARVIEAKQRPLLTTRVFQCVVYEAEGAEPLTAILASGDPARRFGAVTAVLRMMPSWWQSVAEGMLPMPSDIVVREGVPHLLRVPAWGMPAIAELLAEPARVLHLAPELIRDTGPGAGRATDLFALGAMVLSCAFDHDVGDGPIVLQRAAAGVALTSCYRRERLPGWTAGLPAVTEALDRAAVLADVDPAVRMAADRDVVVAALRAAVPAFDPVSSVRQFRDAGDPEAAVRLARQALLADGSYELYLLAADIAATGLHRPLTALTFLEEAALLAPERPESYAGQFDLIGRTHTLILGMLGSADPSFADRLDRIMTTALDRFDPQDREDHLPAMARYLIARERPGAANRLLSSALIHDGKSHWWKFELMIAYGWTFLAAARPEQAAEVAAGVRAGLRRVEANRSVRPDRVGRCGAALLLLEEAVLGHRQDRAGGA
ncbi:hypothetical protein [Winogradskya humida]|uniref:Uncharacterized protein n=1 Tax=Winogradskya humida TaxID=113566 RepID=A0ABQ4A1B3_9ACTN|nr:hypothetical protein [Actinoplanes humidus]GIE24650.1 hypothetical protein Ahu01nite_077520 [Actinoplanes humidus]